MTKYEISPFITMGKILGSKNFRFIEDVVKWGLYESIGKLICMLICDIEEKLLKGK